MDVDSAYTFHVMYLAELVTNSTLANLPLGRERCLRFDQHLGETMTSDAPTGFRSRTRDVVESFLRTVVLLDDLAVMSTSTSEPTGAEESALLRVPDVID